MHTDDKRPLRLFKMEDKDDSPRLGVVFFTYETVSLAIADYSANRINGWSDPVSTKRINYQP